MANLPRPKRVASDSAAPSALPARCKFGGAARLSVSSGGKGTINQKRQSPRRDKDFGADRRSLATSVKMEAAGIEPALDFDATSKLPCGCVICEECRAALALQIWRPQWLEVAFDDADLQRVIHVWNGLPLAIRSEVMAIVEWRNNSG